MQRVKDNIGLVAAAGAVGVAVGAAIPYLARRLRGSKASVNEQLLGADMSQWFCEVNDQWPGTAHCLKVDEVLHSAPSKYQDVMVFKSTDFGNCLVLDGCIQYTERDEAAYQEMIAHIPMLAHANPQRVLVVGGGDGGVIAQVLKHASVKECTICEIDQMVMDVSERYFERVAPVWKDSRLTVNCGDAAEFMRRTDIKGRFDVIIADTSDPDGPASSLFGPDFYRNMSEALAPGGVICTQAESVWLHMPLIKEIISNAKSLYASVVCHSPVWSLFNIVSLLIIVVSGVWHHLHPDLPVRQHRFDGVPQGI
jgi:spermidine synthase